MQPRNIINALVVLLFASVSAFGQQAIHLPTIGIYDGTIEEHPIILMVEKQSDQYVAGSYVYNRNNAIEERIKFTLIEKDGKLHFSSDSISGQLKSDITDNKIRGKIKDPKFKLLFWKRNHKIHLNKRSENPIPKFNRYQEHLFDSITVQTDVIYGKAKGYWTETPYLDDAYISILAKGLVNFFKGQKMLDLMLDIYQPYGDTHTKRPLLLITHGGAFYIGNKQSETELIMANHFTRLGYVVASINYRMGFRLKGGDIERSGYKAIQDVHAALRFLSNQSEELGIDPTQVFVAGTSAGAIASLNVAFLENNERPKTTYNYLLKKDLGNIEESGNSLTDTFNVRGVVNMWGALTDTAFIDPEKNIPVISFYGNKDDIVPFNHDYPFKNTLTMNRFVMDKMYGSRPIHKRLENLGVRNKIIEFNDCGHEPQLTYFKTVNELMDIIVEESTLFLYPENIPSFSNNNSKWIVDTSQPIKPLTMEINNGTIGYLELEGGVTTSANPNNTSVIWFKNAPKQNCTVYIKSNFDAWDKREINVEIK